jgi:hypothetical protein
MSQMHGAEHRGVAVSGRGIVRKIIPAAVTVLALVSVVAAAPLAAAATTPRAPAPPVRPGVGSVRPAGASDWNNLYSVACPSRDTCIAVGGQSSGALAEVWNGTAWRIVTVPEPKGGGSSLLNSVSCVTANACTAVGYYYIGIRQLPLAEVWNGTAWRVQAVPRPAGPPGHDMTALNGVSCTSRAACAAVGWNLNASYGLVTLAEIWNGTSWKITATPNPAGSGDPSFLLNGVSCTAADACWAVGGWEGFTSHAIGATLAEVWNGTVWKLRPIPNPGGYGGGILLGVSCPGPGSCAAAGDHDDSAGDSQPLAEGWAGKAWTIRAVSAPAGAADTYLNGVSCHAAAACTAVGYYYNSLAGKNVTVAERWGGTSWRLQAPANPTHDSILEAVVCPRADRCVAVGQYYNSSEVGLTLAEVWNGTTWTVQPTPNP